MANVRGYTPYDGCHRWQYWSMGRYAYLASQDDAQEIQVWHTNNNHHADGIGGLSANKYHIELKCERGTCAVIAFE